MSEYIDLSASRNIGYGGDVTLKKLRGELTRFAKIVPASALITIELVESAPGGGKWRRLVARWYQYV
jgi:hypothetical protein